MDNTLDSWHKDQIAGAHVEIWRQRPVDEFSIKHNILSVSDRVWWFIDDGDTANCGWDDEPPIQFTIGSDTTFTLEKDYRVHSKTVPRGTTHQSECVLGIGLNVTGLAKQRVDQSLREVFQKFDAAIVDRGNFRPQAESLWADLQRPQPNGTQDALARPQLVAASTLQMDVASIGVNLVIVTAPTLVPSGTNHPPLPLPALMQAGDSRPFHIDGELLIDKSRFLSQLSSSQTGLAVGPIAGKRRRLTITSPQIETSEGGMVIGVEFNVVPLRGHVTVIRGPWTLIRRVFEWARFKLDEHLVPVQGRLFVTATPSITSDQTAIYLNNVVFDAKTFQAIHRMGRARWIQGSALLQELQIASRVSIEADKQGNWWTIEQAGSQSIDADAYLGTRVDHYAVPSLTLIEDGVAVTAEVDGRVSVVSRSSAL